MSITVESSELSQLHDCGDGCMPRNIDYKISSLLFLVFGGCSSKAARTRKSFALFTLAVTPTHKLSVLRSQFLIETCMYSTSWWIAGPGCRCYPLLLYRSLDVVAQEHPFKFHRNRGVGSGDTASIANLDPVRR